MRFGVLAAIVLALGAAPAPAQSLDGASCERLASSLSLPNTAVTAVQPVTGGTFTPPAPGQPLTDLPAFCRVSLTLTPSTDSDIKSELWLPLTGWNGKFQMVGNGGWGGSIQYAALAAGVKRGYATSSTDTGHVGDTAKFALGHPEKLIDFGYRSVHETTVQSKAAIRAAYGTAPRLSYFTGCSGGGRQAFMEAQRFPEDYDAIVAGAPGYNRTDQSFQLVGQSQATQHDKASNIPPAKLEVLHQAALKACDGRDGVVDGLISDPLRCTFDPEVVTCRGEDGPSCLTVPQVDAAKRIYAPVLNPATGSEVFPGVEPGSEPRWRNTAGARPLGMAEELFKYVVFQDESWNFMDLEVAAHLEKARTADGGTISPTSANIKAFTDRGGKMIMYHGWGDTNIPPRSSVQYFDRLVQTLGAQTVNNSIRLYMAPGMGHCGGGEGPNVFDMLTPLEQWREQGKAPAEVIASHATPEGKVDRTRPLCPYPQIAYYKGTGSIDEAQNFACEMPR